MKKLLTLLIVAGMLISAGGCATIMNGTTDTVNISSRPPDAKFSVVSVRDSGRDKNNRTTVITGRTPQNVTLQRKIKWDSHYVVEFNKEGWTKLTVPIEEGVSGWFFGNILFGGPIGCIVDMVTGACVDLRDAEGRLYKQ